MNETMSGDYRTTIQLSGIKSPKYTVTVPKALIRELHDKGIIIEDRDEIKIWIEKTGNKTPPRKNAFGKYNLEAV